MFHKDLPKKNKAKNKAAKNKGPGSIFIKVFLLGRSGQPPVLRRFGDVGWLDASAISEIGDAAGNAQDAVQGAG